ncbi:MAG TPA: lipocalin-like domain-containing protein [Thermoanaerobaculia bacterium]|nr:lipocalin-like domain-containing protein [Thermoanaerobaculia bacterium]
MRDEVVTLLRVTCLAVLASSLIPHPSSLGNDFRLAVPGYQFEFPRDHGSHDEYRTEWWYYTGHLRTDGGRRYGFEVTFFRVGVTTGEHATNTRWDLRHLALAHFAITDITGGQFRYYEKLNRVSPFTAGAATGRLQVFNEGWRATTAADGSWRLQASANGDAIDLVLRAAKPPAVHGENGVSVKAEGEGYASHYYSMTRLLVSGSVTAKGRKAEPCSGLAWMDHEFGSAELREHQQGWDWFSVQLDNETELMLYVIRKADGTPDVTSSGSLITDTGRVIHIRHDQMRIRPERTWRSPRSGATYPLGWTLDVPSLRITLRVTPLLDDQELVTKESTQVTYWEGAVDVTGSFNDISVRGAGYVEMTGYDRAFRQP